MISAALIAAAGALFMALSYIACATPNAPALAVLAGLLPLAALALLLCWRSRLRLPALALWLAVLIAVVWNRDLLQGHAAWVYLAQHAGAMALLAVMFGSTLRGGDANALCSRVAAFQSVDLPDARRLRYTWQVTLAWTLFFVATGALSLLLFFFGTMAHWSLFANVLTPALVGAMFGVEYLVRRRVLPGRPHLGLSETLRAYRDYRRNHG
ncbi:MAG: hypothetical protein OJF60_000201 [Burkholderiaceae bacterium]|jgi:uncharacterized membrane protein|nr:MAG: hypothetical protein OJF60_000201 [Burkholderiaceae bacterium]